MDNDSDDDNETRVYEGLPQLRRRPRRRLPLVGEYREVDGSELATLTKAGWVVERVLQREVVHNVSESVVPRDLSYPISTQRAVTTLQNAYLVRRPERSVLADAEQEIQELRVRIADAAERVSDREKEIADLNRRAAQLEDTEKELAVLRTQRNEAQAAVRKLEVALAKVRTEIGDARMRQIVEREDG